MNILSIDWDYFMKATHSQRFTLFPDGGNEHLPMDVQEYIWMTLYQRPVLEKIEAIPEYNNLRDIMEEYVELGTPVMIADSHKHIYNFIKENIDIDEPINLVNVDYHHDLFEIEGRDEVNCGNWLRHIMNEYPENSTYTWISRKDSETSDIDNRAPNLHVVKEDLSILKQSWDAVYICRSGMWSPPHLDHIFIDTFEWMQESHFLKYETTIFDDRYDEKFIENIRTFRDAMNEISASFKNSQSLK